MNADEIRTKIEELKNRIERVNSDHFKKHMLGANGIAGVIEGLFFELDDIVASFKPEFLERGLNRFMGDVKEIEDTIAQAEAKFGIVDDQL